MVKNKDLRAKWIYAAQFCTCYQYDLGSYLTYLYVKSEDNYHLSHKVVVNIKDLICIKHL